jgi:integrase
MAITGKLKALNVAREKRPGTYGDGGGLYLQVGKGGAKSWIFRFWIAEQHPATGEPMRDPTTHKLNGRIREMGLGSYITVSLQEARDRALECRKLREKGIDPIEAREAAQRQTVVDRARSLKFSDAATTFMTAHRAAWTNEKHAAQWQATLEKYVYPIIGRLSLQSIDTTLVLKVLEPIWSIKPETASRLRGRIESVLDWATVRGYRTGDNPARWRGHLDKLLPARSKVRKVKHHAALAYVEMSAFMEALRAQEGIAARALEFTILTAARTGETIGAIWKEINWREKYWAVPASRMKAGKEHRVPLCDRALAILRDMKPADEIPNAAEQFIFGPGNGGRPLSNMSFLMLLRRMDRADITVHGFRSSFRDWAAERTNFPSEVAELALAHAVGNKVESAYRRSDLFERRRRIMAEWANFCGTQIAASERKVLPLRTQ